MCIGKNPPCLGCLALSLGFPCGCSAFCFKCATDTFLNRSSIVQTGIDFMMALSAIITLNIKAVQIPGQLAQGCSLQLCMIALILFLS